MKRILFIILLALILTGCKTKNSEKEDAGRFEMVYRERMGWGCIRIIRDNETGAEYMFIKDRNAGGVTQLKQKTE